jgi:hypothetical protein
MSEEPVTIAEEHRDAVVSLVDDDEIDRSVCIQVSRDHVHGMAAD